MARRLAHPSERPSRRIAMSFRRVVRLVLLSTVCGIVGSWVVNRLPSPRSDATDGFAVTIAAVPNSDIAPPWTPAQPYRQTFSVRRTYNTRLDTCFDFVVEIVPPEMAESDWLPQPPADLFLKLGKLGVAIERPCAEQFAERSVLATCITTNRRGNQTLRLFERHYDYVTVGVDDARMDECLRLGGDWQALAKNSEAFLHAKHAAIVQDLETMSEGS